VIGVRFNVPVFIIDRIFISNYVLLCILNTEHIYFKQGCSKYFCVIACDVVLPDRSVWNCQTDMQSPS